MDIINFIIGNWDAILQSVIGVVGVFALVATQTGNTSDDEWVAKIQSLINFLGANFGKAKNDPKV